MITLILAAYLLLTGTPADKTTETTNQTRIAVSDPGAPSDPNYHQPKPGGNAPSGGTSTPK